MRENLYCNMGKQAQALDAPMVTSTDFRRHRCGASDVNR